MSLDKSWKVCHYVRWVNIYSVNTREERVDGCR